MAHRNPLPGTVLGGRGAFRVLGDGALLNVEQTGPVAVVVERELATGFDRDATHAELTPGHPRDLMREIQCGQELRPEALALLRRHPLRLSQREHRQYADEPTRTKRN